MKSVGVGEGQTKEDHERRWDCLGLELLRLWEKCLELGGPSAISAIEPLHRDKDPVIRELAETTYKLFKKVAHKLTSSNIKQSCQKMFNFIYIKKLKLLYNYNGTNNLTHGPTGIKETRKKKRSIYINYEDIWWAWDVLQRLGVQLRRGMIFFSLLFTWVYL